MTPDESNKSYAYTPYRAESILNAARLAREVGGDTVTKQQFNQLYELATVLWQEVQSRGQELDQEQAVVQNLKERLNETTFAVNAGIDQMQELLDNNPWKDLHEFEAMLRRNNTIDRLNTLMWVREVLKGKNPLTYKEAKENAPYAVIPSPIADTPRQRPTESTSRPNRKARKGRSR